DHPTLGAYHLACEPGHELEMLFTENETHAELLFGSRNESPFVKDAFHRRVIAGERGAVNPACSGTKAAAWYRLTLAAGQSQTLRFRLRARGLAEAGLGADFESVLSARRE